MKTLMATNIRGGCGKTTNVLHTAIAATLSKHNNRVLAIDLDPQAHLTRCLVDSEELDDGGSGHIDDLLQGEKVSPMPTHYKNLSLIPSSMKLTLMQKSPLLEGRSGRELLMKRLERFRGDFDYAFIDTPAAYSLIHILAIRASDAYVISMRPEAFSLVGFAESIAQNEGLKRDFGVDRPVYLGYFLNGVPKARRLAIERIREIIATEYEEYAGAGYEIRQSSLFDEARWSPRQSIFLHPSTTELQQNYKTAWKKLAERLEAL